MIPKLLIVLPAKLEESDFNWILTKASKYVRSANMNLEILLWVGILLYSTIHLARASGTILLPSNRPDRVMLNKVKLKFSIYKKMRSHQVTTTKSRL